MLNVLRQKGWQKKILWFITVIIILSFAIFGSAYRLDNHLNSAGSMFGKNVTFREFKESYLDARDQAIIAYGDQFFKNGQAMDLEQQAWDRLILSRETDKANLKISDQEVVNHIAQIPYFQRQGQFDPLLYRSIVTNRSIFDRASTRDFEEGIRRDLAIRKLLDTVAGPLDVSEEELKKEYTLRHEKITLDYVLFNPDHFTQGITPSADDINAYYLQNKERFRKPVVIKVDYIHLVLNDKATPAQQDEAKKNIYNMSAQLTATSDFDAVAKKFNLEVKHSDYFSQEQPLLTFASSPEDLEKMFALKQGQFTKPINVPDGWQIIRINDKKESQVPALADITEDVKAAFIREQAYNKAKAKADEIIGPLAENLKNADFKAAAAQLNLKAEQTPSFSRGEYIANVGLIQEIQQETVKLTPEHPLSGVVTTSQGPVIAHLAKSEPIDEEQYKEGKEEFKQMFQAQRRQQKIGMFLTQLRLTANVKSKVKHQK